MRRRQRTPGRAAAVWTAGLVLAACTGGADVEAPAAPDEPEEVVADPSDDDVVTIGLVTDPSSPRVAVAVRTAAEAMSASGGVLERRLRLVEIEVVDDAEVAKAAHHTLVERDGADVVISGLSAGSTEAMADGDPDAAPAICTGAQRSDDASGAVVSTAPSMPVLGRAIAGDLAVDGATAPVTVVADEATRGDALVAALRESGAIADVLDGGGAALGEGIPAGTVVLALFDQAALDTALASVSETPGRFTGRRVYAPWLAHRSPAVRSGPESAVGLRVIGPPTESAGPSRLFSALRNADLEPGDAASYFDCAVVAALAAQAAGSGRADAIRRHIEPVTGGAVACESFRDCAPLARSGASIAYVGESGPLGIVDGLTTSGRVEVREYQVVEPGLPTVPVLVRTIMTP